METLKIEGRRLMQTRGGYRTETSDMEGHQVEMTLNYKRLKPNVGVEAT